jgi:hypothetical protein
MPDHMRQVELTLETARPEVITRAGGGQYVAMEGFGTDSAPGAPKLPTLLCHVELPKDAAVLGLNVVGDEPTAISGRFRIAAASPTIRDEPGDEESRVRERDAAQQAAERNRRRIYGSDRWYPASPALLEAVESTATSVQALLRVRPVSYNPVAGNLRWTPAVRALLRYSLPEDVAEAFGDVLVTTAAQPRINPFAPTTLAPASLAATAPSPVDDAVSYLIVVPDAATEQAMRRFVTWKESIGHSVEVEQLPTILSSFSGVDDAERVREFLIDRHRAWGVHYVLLVGTMGTIPTRLLYMDDRTDAYASDFYFANLATVDWDLDNDGRWGEFADDRYSRGYDVVVGRLPLDTVADVRRYCDNAVAFERDTGAWKRNALFAAGFMDFRPTDGAELCERLIDDVLIPAGWTARTLYEQGGTYPSQHGSDAALSQPNYANECVTRPYGLVTLVAHGDWDRMYARQCTDPGRNCDGNFVDNRFGDFAGIPASCPSAIVNMIGCSTACPVGDYKHVETQPGGPVVNPGRSRYPFASQQDHNGARYLRNGAVAAIGASAGVDYAGGWRDPGDGRCWSAAYYVHDELITHGKPVGDAFFEGMYTYACRHPLLRGVRDLYLMGDPSLIAEGIGILNPEGSDVLIHGERWSHFAASYDRNGDIYVVISIGASAEPAEFLVYKSVDHGRSWVLWNHVEGLPPIISLDAIVNHGGTDEFAYDDLLVFTTSLDDTIRLHTFPLIGATHTMTTVLTVNNLYNVLSVAHDSLHRGSRLYLGYCFLDSTGQPHSVVKVSRDNGRNWPHRERFPGYWFPSIDGGPRDHVHVAALRNNHAFDVCVATSTDGGQSWGGWSNLTRLDGANEHYDASTPPVVAASTDPLTPTVWVSYQRRYRGLVRPRRADLGFAHSVDQGQTWERNMTLAAGPGDTKWVQLAGYKPDPNPWVNGVYVSAQPTGISSTNARVLRRALNGRDARRLPPATIFNHVEAVDHRPQLVYSPGAPGTGGGTVFAGSNGVYFSAPWLP